MTTARSPEERRSIAEQARTLRADTSLSMGDIASRLHVNEMALRMWLQEIGALPVGKKRPGAEVKAWAKDYEGGASIATIAKTYRVATKTVYDRIKQDGVKMRSRSEASEIVQRKRAQKICDEAAGIPEPEPVFKRAPVPAKTTNDLEITERRCLKVIGPCPRQSCRHWIEGGDCAVKLASMGPMDLPTIAAAMDISKQAVHVLLVSALRKLRKAGALPPEMFGVDDVGNPFCRKLR